MYFPSNELCWNVYQYRAIVTTRPNEGNQCFTISHLAPVPFLVLSDLKARVSGVEEVVEGLVVDLQI